MGQGRRALRFVRLPVRHAERPLYTALSGRTWNRRKRRDALFSVSRPIRQWRWTGADKSGNPGISSIQISRLGRGPAKIPEIHMSCPICKKIGETPSGHSVVHCKAFDHQAVCMRHCMACKYHREQCSTDWCGYRTAKEKAGDVIGSPV